MSLQAFRRLIPILPLHRLSRRAGGSFRLRSFDLLGEYSNGTATLKHETTKHLSLHDMDSLTAQEGNVHDLLADSPSQVIDISSPHYNDGRIENTRWYNGASNSQLSPGEELQAEVLQ